MKRKTLQLILLSFLSVISYTHAGAFVKLSQKELQNFSFAKKRSIYNSYLKFHILDERNSPYPRSLISSTSKLEAIGEYTSLFIIEDTFANNSNSCFYGGYVSERINNVCAHPAKSKNSGYKSSCSSEQFQCHPVLFKKGACVDNGPHVNLADACLKKAKLSKDEINKMIGSQEFMNYNKAVYEYCEKTGNNDECLRLQDEITGITKADDSIKSGDLISDVEETLKKVNTSNLPKSCFEAEGIQYCPDVVSDSLDDAYSNGIVGSLNYIFTLGEGKMKDPRSICDSSLPKDIDIVKLKEELKRRFPNDSLLSDFAASCEKIAMDNVEKGRKGQDSIVAPAYMMVDYNTKTEKLQKGINDLLESKATLDATLGENTYKCDDYKTSKTNSDRCMDLKSCNLGKSNELYTRKLDSVKSAVEAARKIQDELAKTNSQIPSGRAYGVSPTTNYAQIIQKQKDLKLQLNQILDQNPMLRGKHFKKIMNGVRSRPVGGGYSTAVAPPSDKEIDIALKNQMKDTSKEINSMVSDYQNALNCLNGQSSSCGDFDKVMRRTNYDNTNRFFKDSPNLNKFNTFYSCVEDSKKNRDEADEILADVGITIALSFTPFAAVNAIRIAASAGKIIKTAAAASRATSAVTKSSLLADGVFTADQVSQVYDSCKESEQAFLHTRGVENKSCNERVRESIAATNLDRCATQASVSAALGLPIALSAFKLAKLPKTEAVVPKVATPKVERAPVENKLATLAQKEKEIALKAQLRERAALQTGENKLATLTQKEKEIALKAQLKERVAAKTGENRLAILAQKEKDIAQKAVATKSSVVPYTHVGELVEPGKSVVPFKAKPALEGPVYEGKFADLGKMKLLNPPTKAQPSQTMIPFKAPLALPAPKSTALVPATGTSLVPKATTEVSQRTAVATATKEGEYIAKAQDVVPYKARPKIEADAIEVEFTDITLKDQLRQRAALRTGENKLATLAQKEKEIALKAQLKERAALQTGENKLATLAQKEDEILRAKTAAPSSKPSSTLSDKARLVLRAADSEVGKAARRTAQVAYTNTRDNERPNNIQTPGEEERSPAAGENENENENENEEQVPSVGSEGPEKSEIVFDVDAIVDYENDKAKVTLTVKSEIPTGHTVSYESTCDDSVQACTNSDSVFHVPLKTRENNGVTIARLLKDGALVKGSQVNFTIKSINEGKGSGGISLDIVTEDGKSVELKVKKTISFEKNHTWFCSKIKPKKDEEAKPACSESEGGEKKTFPRKLHSYFVKVRQPANGGGPDLEAKIGIRKCDSEACIAANSSNREPAMQAPPTGTNTPPNNLNFNIPKRRIIISPGFL